MLLLLLLVATSFWSRGDAQAAPVQRPAEHRLVEGSSVTMTCQLSSDNIVHWYRQLPGEPPKRILYMSGYSPIFDDSSDSMKFQAQKNPSNYVLTIKKATRRDTGTYYCAYWYYQQTLPEFEWIKYFGTGTKLIVTNKASSAPENFEILQEEHEKQLVYVCLIEKFYPAVIRVKWIDEKNKEVTQNVVKGDVWKSPDEDKYSVSSWLSVSLESKNKKYFCNYDHESGERSLPTQASSESSPWEQKDCGTQSGNSTVFNRDHLTHKAAQLVYVVLLLKSSMYYVIVLFFFFKYKTSSAAKPMGKKT